MKPLALVTAIAANGHDEDQPLLLDACLRAGIDVRSLAWDDPSVGWSRFGVVLLRSPWDYTERLLEFLTWCERTDRMTTLLNPLPVVRWNTDKRYLADLAGAGVPVIPCTFIAPDTEPMEALQDFLVRHTTAEFVVKPVVGAGARDVQRYLRNQEFAAGNHLARLLDEYRHVMLQPYLPHVDTEGETALIYFDGQFSHAIRKAALLKPGATAGKDPFTTGDISSRLATEAQRKVAEQALAATARLFKLDRPLPYARIDLIPDQDGAPRLLELELTEPSLFLRHAPEAADRFASVLATWLAQTASPARAEFA